MSGARTRAGIGRLATRIRRRLRNIVDRVRVSAREALFPLRVQWLSGPRRVGASAEEFIVVCLVRNGAVFLAEFLRHYRELGAKHIVLLDNGSTDETPTIAAAEPDVTVFRTMAPYKVYKDVMKRWLVAQYGRRNWVLCVDIDELFDYPFRNEMPTVDLLRYLNRRGFNAVVAQMLDMFPRTAITDFSATAWRGAHRYYSLRDLEKVPYQTFYGARNKPPPAALDVIHGGIRSTAFEVRAMLTKHPLLFPARGIEYLQSHHVRGAHVADMSAVLLHYKFVGDFTAYVKAVVEAESFWNDSQEYKQYLRAIEDDPDLSLYTANACEFSTVERLVEQRFLTASDRFLEEVAKFRRRDMDRPVRVVSSS